MKKYTFGINITKYVKDHEEFIQSIINENKQDYIEYHLRRLNFLQHERIIHLIVTFMTLVVLLLSMICTFILVSYFKLIFSIVDLTIFTLFLFYLKHYFFLENHVQYWYILYDILTED